MSFNMSYHKIFIHQLRRFITYNYQEAKVIWQMMPVALRSIYLKPIELPVIITYYYDL